MLSIREKLTIMCLKGMRQLRDTFGLGMFSGQIGNLAKGLFNFVTWKTHYNEVLYPQLGGAMFFGQRNIKRRRPFIIGSLADITMGSLFGIPIVYIMKKTGKDNYLIKGVGFSLLLWVGFYGLGQSLNLYNYKLRKARSPILSFFDHLLYGAVTASAAVKLADPGTFPDDQLSDYYTT